MQKIIPTLWYDDDAVEAARTYVSLVPGSRLGNTVDYGGVGQEIHGRPAGSVMLQDFELAGTRVTALNGGPHFRFTPAISLFVTLPDRAAVDRLWSGLADGGEVLMPIDAYPWSERYGWLNDRWGLSWQIALGDPAQSGRAVAPLLSFAGPRAGGAEAAIRDWTALFPDSAIAGLARYGADGIPAAEGGAQGLAHGQFSLMGETFMAMDAFGPHAFDFNEAVSLLVRCPDQAEIDRLWAALSAVPEAEACGWLKDRHGVSWQVAAESADRMIADTDRVRADRVMQALLGMKKVDVAALEAAYAG
jgi:predicted 3-demethylubiquinone-9 3-methyltransferase (glyoxalase superfamily)